MKFIVKAHPRDMEKILKNDFDRFIKMIQDINDVVLSVLWVESGRLQTRVTKPGELTSQI